MVAATEHKNFPITCLRCQMTNTATSLKTNKEKLNREREREWRKRKCIYILVNARAWFHPRAALVKKKDESKH